MNYNDHKLLIKDVGIRIDKQYPLGVCSRTPYNALLGDWYACMNEKKADNLHSMIRFYNNILMIFIVTLGNHS